MDSFCVLYFECTERKHMQALKQEGCQVRDRMRRQDKVLSVNCETKLPVARRDL